MMNYKLIRTKRKTIGISVDDSLNVIVRAPYFMPKDAIDKCVKSNIPGIQKAVERKRNYIERFNSYSSGDISLLKERAKKIIFPKVEYYSKIMGVFPGGVKITSAKKRFGSCSSKNSICFSCYLAEYPEEAIDYVVVHELAHITEKNHSKRFYSLVNEVLPDYKSREALLKK